MDQWLHRYWLNCVFNNEPRLRLLSEILADGGWLCLFKVTQKLAPLRWLATASSPWREQRTVRDWLAAGQGPGRPLGATHIFLSEAGGPSFWSDVRRQVHFSFWWGTTWPRGPISRERRNSCRIKETRGFCDEGVERLNGVDGSRPFLRRVSSTILFKFWNVDCLCNRYVRLEFVNV